VLQSKCTAGGEGRGDGCGGGAGGERAGTARGGSDDFLGRVEHAVGHTSAASRQRPLKGGGNKINPKP